MEFKNGFTTTHTMDLRQITPEERNVRVFQAFESVHAGTVFIIIDNKTLEDIHEQFKHDCEGRFQWKDLAQGPDCWQALIAKINGLHFDL